MYGEKSRREKNHQGHQKQHLAMVCVLDEGPGARFGDPSPPQWGSRGEMSQRGNYDYLVDWAYRNRSDEKAQGIIRLMYRMLGIYHGAADKAPVKDVKFDDLRLARHGSGGEEDAHSGDEPLTFIDIYFINGQMDLWDAAGKEIRTGSQPGGQG